VIIPMTMIFVMNAAIGVKICRYTGRTVDNPSTQPAAAPTAAASASNSVDDFYSNCSTVQKYRMRHIGDLRSAKENVTGPQNGLNVHVSSAGGVGTATLLKPPSVGPSSAACQNHVSAASSTAARSWRVLTRRHQTQLRITKALLVVSTVFVALNLPSYAFRIHAFRIHAFVIDLRNEPYEMSLHAFIWQEFIQFL